MVDIDVAISELDVALESLDSNTIDMDRVMNLLTTAEQSGVDQSLILAMESFDSTALPSEYPVESFTIEPSAVNQVVAVESLNSILTSLGKSRIKIIIAIITIIAVVIKLIMSLYSNIGDSGKRDRGRTKTEKVKEAYTNVRKFVTEAEEKRGGLDIDVTTLIAALTHADAVKLAESKKFNTRLHIDIASGTKHTSIESMVHGHVNVMEVYEVIVESLNVQHGIINDIINNVLVGKALHGELLRYEESMHLSTLVKMLYDPALAVRRINIELPTAPKPLGVQLKQTPQRMFWNPKYTLSNGSAAEIIPFTPIYSSGMEEILPEYVFPLDDHPYGPTIDTRRMTRNLKSINDAIDRSSTLQVGLSKNLSKIRTARLSSLGDKYPDEVGHTPIAWPDAGAIDTGKRFQEYRSVVFPELLITGRGSVVMYKTLGLLSKYFKDIAVVLNEHNKIAISKDVLESEFATVIRVAREVLDRNVSDAGDGNRNSVELVKDLRKELDSLMKHM